VISHLGIGMWKRNKKRKLKKKKKPQQSLEIKRNRWWNSTWNQLLMQLNIPPSLSGTETWDKATKTIKRESMLQLITCKDLSVVLPSSENGCTQDSSKRTSSNWRYSVASNNWERFTLRKSAATSQWIQISLMISTLLSTLSSCGLWKVLPSVQVWLQSANFWTYLIPSD